METISTVRHSPGYKEAFKSFIYNSKEQALEKIKVIECTHPVQVFCDGSGFEEGVGASAVLHIDNLVVKVLHYHLGSEKEHTVYEAEGIGIAMALHMLKTRNRQLTKPLSICSDSQALLKAPSNQRSHAGHYILNKIHDSAESLHAKQDSLLNRSEHLETLVEGCDGKVAQMEYSICKCIGYRVIADTNLMRKQTKKRRKRHRAYQVKLSYFPHSCVNSYWLVFQHYAKIL
jgi:hypothetical protein